MAGRRAHVDGTKFVEFLQSIPEDALGQGYWRIKRETKTDKGGGVLQSVIGYLEFKSDEGYAELRDRIREEMANHRGPGVYYAIPCDQTKKELKNVDMARFEYKDGEVEMAEPQVPDNASPLGDTLKAVKKVAQDAAALQNIDFQRQILERYLGNGKDKKEENEVKETSSSGGMDQLLMMKMLFGDENKKATTTPAAEVQQLIDAKLQGAMAEMKGLVSGLQGDLKVMQITSQQKPSDDGKFERLLERIITRDDSSKNESSFQQMMTLQMKQAEDRDRSRQEEDRRRDETRRGEETRREEARREDEKKLVEERRIEEKRREDERIRYEGERKAEEKRREDERKAEEKRRDEERKGEEKRREEELKLERQKWEESIKTEREKSTETAKEERRRYDEELKIRREEMKLESEKSRTNAVEQQKYQLQILDLVKNSKESGLELTAKVMETMTTSGMASMKTAHEAATSIIDIAKRAGPHKEEGGIGDTIKDIAGLAAPLLAPYADAHAKAGLMQQLQAQRAAMGGTPKRPRPEQPAPAPAPAPAVTSTPAADNANMSGTTGSETKPKEGFSMIAQYMKTYPVMKYAMLGNIKDKIGVKKFLPIITGLNQETLEGLLANLPPEVLMSEVKQVCTDEEKKLVDENKPWFEEFRKEMIALLDEEEEEEEEVPAKK